MDQRQSSANPDEKELFHLLIEYTQDILAFVTPDGILRYESPSVSNILGYIRGENYGRELISLIHPDDKEKVLSSLATGKEPTTVQIHYVARVRHKNGSYRTLDFATKFVNSNGISGLIVTLRDITEQEQILKELKETEQFLDTLIESLPVMLFVKEAKNLTFVKFNKAGEELTGVPKGDFLGKNDFDFFTKDQAEFFIKSDREIFISKKIRDIPEEPINTKDKGKRTIHTIKVPILDERGEPLYLLGISEDITDKMKVEELMRLQSTVFDKVVNGVVITDRTGTIIQANSSYLGFMGYSRDEVIGKNPRMFNSGHQDQAFYKKLWDTILSGHSWHGELINKKKDGTVFAEEMTITPVKDTREEITHFVAIKQDISERKASNEALQERTRELERMNALMVGRELKMVELKSEIDKLKSKLEQNS